MLVAVTVLVGVLLAADLILGAAVSHWQRPFGVVLALVAAVIRGGPVVDLAILGLFERSIGADQAVLTGGACRSTRAREIPSTSARSTRSAGRSF